MKTINIKLGIKEILGIVIIIIMLSFSFSNLTYDARFRFGNVILLDTLTGSLKVQSGGIYTDDTIYTTGGGHFGLMTGFPAGIMFTSDATYIDDDGNDLRYNVTGTGQHIFSSNGTGEVALLDTLDGLKALREITFNNVDTTSKPANGTEIKMYLKNEYLIIRFSTSLGTPGTNVFFYLDLNAGTDQNWIYSATEP